jgi:hypothetical protein
LSVTRPPNGAAGRYEGDRRNATPSDATRDDKARRAGTPSDATRHVVTRRKNARHDTTCHPIRTVEAVTRLPYRRA